jgi:hypothetical protein
MDSTRVIATRLADVSVDDGTSAAILDRIVATTPAARALAAQQARDVADVAGARLMTRRCSRRAVRSSQGASTRSLAIAPWVAPMTARERVKTATVMVSDLHELLGLMDQGPVAYSGVARVVGECVASDNLTRPRGMCAADLAAPRRTAAMKTRVEGPSTVLNPLSLECSRPPATAARRS